MIKNIISILFLMLANTICYADEKVQAQGFNEDAIPEVITPKDRKVSVKPTTYVGLKRADYILKDATIGGKKVPSMYDQHIERKQKEKFDQNPKQSRSVKECIKPDGTLDNEVQACVQGFIEPYWKK